MTKAKHTPGPWSVKETMGVIFVGSEISSRKVVADCGYYGSPEVEADARLIAAAPDLLEALESLVSLIDNHAPFGGEIYQDRIDRAWDKTRAAIAKATE